MTWKCNLCPRKCNVDRKNQLGLCGASTTIKIARAALHFWEEPCISVEKGSGTIFFSHCSLQCVFCQNYRLSHDHPLGEEITISQFADICLDLQEQGANNINLVTPTHYVPWIVEGIKLAKKRGLHLPIVYNTSAYESVETIRMLDGIVDIYLPDLKYYSNTLSKKYSNVDNYFEMSTMAIKEMYKQVGTAQFDENGIIQQGIIIRHLVLPNHLQNSKHILKWIKENMPNDIYVSVMAQYFPTYKAKQEEYINRKLNLKEYKEIENFLFTLGLENGYMQDLGKHEEEYVPKWDI